MGIARRQGFPLIGVMPKQATRSHGAHTMDRVPKLKGTRTKSGVLAGSRAKKISTLALDAGPFKYTTARSVKQGFPATVMVCAPVYSMRTE